MKTRRRLNPAHRWSPKETECLLEGVLSQLEDHRTPFEQPTSKRFYNKLKENYVLLAKLDWTVMKSKMRNLKTLYIQALQWKKVTKSCSLSEEQEMRITNYLNKICPHFDELNRIFGQTCSNVKSTVKMEITADSKLPTFFGNRAQQKEVRSSSEPLPPLPSTPSPTNSNSVQILQSMQQERLDREEKMLEEKLKVEERIWQEQLQLEKEKIVVRQRELESQEKIALTKLQTELEEKKMRIEMEERVKKYDLELKYKQ